MASVSLFGGGFFYAPFSRTIVQRAILGTDALANTFGAYATMVAVTPVTGRWMELELTDPLDAASRLWMVELAQGAIGAEVPWIPSAGSGFPGLILDGDLPSNRFSRVYGFPISIPAGIRISARVQVNFAGPLPLNLTLTYWG